VNNFRTRNSEVFTLMISAESNSFFKQSWRVLVQLFLIAIVCILIPIIFLFFYGTRLIGSILTLVGAVRSVSRGNYEYRINVKRKDEIGSLLDSFNDMTTALKENTDRLEEKNKELTILNYFIDSVFNSLLINTLVIDEDYNILMFNQSAKSNLRFTKNADSMSLFSLPLIKNKKENIKGIIDFVFKEQKQYNIPEVKNNRKIYSLDFFPVLKTEIENNIIILLITDITEQITMEKALIRSEKLASIGQLAAGFAHEIGNPMGIILNHVQLLGTGKLDKQEEQKFIERIESEVKRINKLMEKMLLFSRNETLNVEKISMKDFVFEVIELFRPKFDRKGIKVNIENHANDTFIYCDKDALKQVFFNVLNNAFQAINDENGKINVCLRENKKYLLVDIEDNGIGMSQNTIEQIFDPFFSKKASQSTGLGLYLSLRIMKKHKGDIKVKSKITQGTVISLEFLKKREING